MTADPNEMRPQPPSGPPLFPSMATYPVPAVYVGESVRTSPDKRATAEERHLAPGDGVLILGYDDGRFLAVSNSGYVFSLSVFEVRLQVGVPWLRTLIMAANGFAEAIDPRKRAEGEERRAAEKARERIVVPSGPVSVDMLKDGERIG